MIRMSDRNKKMKETCTSFTSILSEQRKRLYTSLSYNCHSSMNLIKIELVLQMNKYAR